MLKMVLIYIFVLVNSLHLGYACERFQVFKIVYNDDEKSLSYSILSIIIVRLLKEHMSCEK